VALLPSLIVEKDGDWDQTMQTLQNVHKIPVANVQEISHPHLRFRVTVHFLQNPANGRVYIAFDPLIPRLERVRLVAPGVNEVIWEEPPPPQPGDPDPFANF
jgi:hypothetical protein